MPDTDAHLSAETAYEDTEWISVGKAATLLGVSVQTMQRWDRAGILPAHRSVTNQRRYRRDELAAFRPIRAA
jgi:excisionase family DNA binding protein